MVKTKNKTAIILAAFFITILLSGSEIVEASLGNLNEIVNKGKISFERINLNFIKTDSRIVFYEETITSELDYPNLTGILFLNDTNKVLLSVYENDAGIPYVGELLLYDIDRDQENELVVLIKRKQIVRAEQVNSIFHKIYIYDNALEENSGIRKLVTMKNIMKEFEEGDDGIFHGKEVRYEYKSASTILKKLKNISRLYALDNNQFFKSIVSSGYERAFANYKGKKYMLAVLALDEVFQKRDIKKANPTAYKKQYVNVLNDYAYFIYKYYQVKAAKSCEYMQYSTEEQRREFRTKTLSKAKDILEYVLELEPNRIVAYLNFADVLYGLDADGEAVTMYQKYKDMMTSSGKQKRIPMRIMEPLKQKKVHICK